MELTELIRHPEKMDRDTLYELRSLVALYPSFQTARLLMLQNLFLLHDQSFDQELRRAAIYITNRNVLFQMIEASHYVLRQENTQKKTAKPKTDQETNSSRTIKLIDTFLDSIPKNDDEEEKTKNGKKRRPTPADAAVDYVAYLLETQNDSDDNSADEAPQLIGHNLIDTFIDTEKGRIKLNDSPTLTPSNDDYNNEDGADENVTDESFFTETLARIYIKQGRYSKALEIISRLSLQYPKKSAYFADQIRFLKKLIINNNKKKQ